MKQVDQCKTSNRTINFIVVDFGQTGDVLRAVADYNGVTPPAASTRPVGEVSAGSGTASTFFFVSLGLVLLF
jgi:hypothetical protein